MRPPLVDRTRAELDLIRAHAEGAGTIVEIGVFEGGTAAILRRCATRELVLVDPYPPGVLWLNMSRVVARRAVRRVPGVPVRWLRMTSVEAARQWRGPIDFLVIDGVHTLEGVQRDWLDWSGEVSVGGLASVRADVVPEEVAARDEMACGDEIVPWILERFPDWELVDRVDTTAVLRRSPIRRHDEVPPAQPERAPVQMGDRN